MSRLSRESSRAESSDGRRSLPLATFRRRDWRQRLQEEAASRPRSQGRASGSRSSLLSEGSLSSRSSLPRKWKNLRPSKSAHSIESGGLLRSLSEHDLQAHRVAGYALALEGADFRIFSEGLLNGSIFGASFAKEIPSLADGAALYSFTPGDVVCKDSPARFIFIVRDGSFTLHEPAAVLGPGCVFGELDLLGLHSHVTCGDAGTCFAIAKEAFLETLKKVTGEASAENYQFLLGSELFRYLDASYLAMLSKCSCSVQHADGALVRADAEGSFLYLVKSGSLILSSDGETSLVAPGETPRQLGLLRANGTTELLAVQMDLLPALLGLRGSHFLWRCELLSRLRDSWAHEAGFGHSLLYRDTPEELARACIIWTFLLDEVVSPDDFLSLAQRSSESIEWLMLLDGIVMVQDSAGCHTLHPGDSYVCPPGGPALQRQAVPESVTLAVLLKDALLPAGAAGDALDVVRKVFLFRTLDEREQWLLADASRLVSRRCGDPVFQEGELASQCFVVVEGEMTQSKEGRVMRTLGAFTTFGEHELLNQLPRNFSVTCKSETARLMAIDKMVFEHVVKERVFAQLQDQLQLRCVDINLEDLQEISTLGYGTFGIVRLVEHQASGARYALKCISRSEAVAKRQQARICAERDILTDVDHPFILKLVRTFKDRRNVYFLTEFVTGGELFSAIRCLGILNGSQARFYTGSLILALQALHEKKIIYRDLKPENVLLDSYGYIKLIDFGCAARLDQGRQRSLVGTPHYMAPEVILGNDYNCSCDVWSLGVCLYEFVCGPLPFAQDCEDPKQIFQEILLSKLLFPAHLANSACKHLLRCLLRKNSSLRIGEMHGLQEVRDHVYFRKFSFVRLLARNVEPPLVSSPVTLTSAEDLPVTNFGHVPLGSETAEDWASEF